MQAKYENKETKVPGGGAAECDDGSSTPVETSLAQAPLLQIHRISYQQIPLDLYYITTPSKCPFQRGSRRKLWSICGQWQHGQELSRVPREKEGASRSLKV